MSWLSKGAKSVIKNPVSIVSPVTSAITAATGLSASKQMAIGAGVGATAGLAGMAAGGAGAVGGTAATGAAGGMASAAGVPAGYSMSSLLPSLIAGGASIYGATQQAGAQQDANAANIQIAQQQEAFSAQQAQQQMDFQERMSDTAYQRTTADMKAAGINPMLAYMQGGASTPSGAMGSSAGADVKAVPSIVGNSINSALDAMKTIQGFQATQSQINANNAAAGLSKQKTRVDSLEGDLADTASQIFQSVKQKWNDSFVPSAKQWIDRNAASPAEDMDHSRTIDLGE